MREVPPRSTQARGRRLRSPITLFAQFGVLRQPAGDHQAHQESPAARTGAPARPGSRRRGRMSRQGIRPTPLPPGASLEVLESAPAAGRVREQSPAPRAGASLRASRLPCSPRSPGCCWAHTPPRRAEMLCRCRRRRRRLLEPAAAHPLAVLLPQGPRWTSMPSRRPPATWQAWAVVRRASPPAQISGPRCPAPTPRRPAATRCGGSGG